MTLEMSPQPPTTRKYICLASYNCPCRPPGKGVGKMTVRRHCALANEERKLYPELGLLQLGPRFSSEELEWQKIDHGRFMPNVITFRIVLEEIF